MPRKEAGKRPSLSREQALQMMDELIEAYSKVEFQQELHQAWAAVAGDPIQQGRARQAVCLKVQGPIIERYGFEASRRGVALSVTAFNESIVVGCEEEAVRHKCFMVGWLVNPAQQEASERTQRDQYLASVGLPPSQPDPGEQQDVEALPDTYPVPFTHLYPERPLQYGGFMGGTARAPSAFLALPPGVTEHLNPLVEYLRNDPEGPFAGRVDEWPVQGVEPSGRWGEWGFDVGAQGKEQLLKADWHSVHSWGSVRHVFVPRFGDCINMRRAPPRILAFLEAFREVNLHCWYSMLTALEELKNRKDSSKSLRALVDLVCHVIRERGQFGAIEAQVWWGPESTPTRSHKDGATSLLHLSITLGGHRSLRIGTFEKADSFGPSPWVYNREEWARWQRFQKCDDSAPPTTSEVMKENNVWDDEAWREDDLRKVGMSAGDIYLSAPFIFEHGVMYDRCTRHAPIIALQCRTAFQFAKTAFKVNELRSKDMLAVTQVLAKCLREIGDNGWLRLPSLWEVAGTEQRIREHLATQMAAIAGGRYVQNIFHSMSMPAAQGSEGSATREWDFAQDHNQTEVAELNEPQFTEETEETHGHSQDVAWKDEAGVAQADDQGGSGVDPGAITGADPGAIKGGSAWWAEDDLLEMQMAEIRRKAAEELQKLAVKPAAPAPETERERSARLVQQFGQGAKDVEPHMPDAQLWVAVGGVDTGGILVRKEQDLNSERLRAKLATGAVLEQLEVVGNRLHYRRLKGEGPDYGWVSTVMNATGKVLVERI